ncbi:MAG: hypothetical protein QW279_09840 [Candidatus Jordarchaeaceae archaeon]
MSKIQENKDTISSVKNEFIVEGDPDAKITLLIAKSSIQEMDKFYGPIYTRMVSEYALKFESEKLNEKPPENIQGLDQVTDYIMANLNRYPRGYCALFYGSAKTQKNLEGSIGSGARRSGFQVMKSLIESSGMLNSVIGTTEDLLEAIKKSAEIVKAAKIIISMRYIREENNDLTMIVPNCPYKDACRAYMEEGISRMVGGLECTNLTCQAAISEIITKKHLDYRLEEFDKPECRGRIFEI